MYEYVEFYPWPPPPLSRHRGQTGYSIVLQCKSSLCHGQVSFVCVFRGFSCRLCFLRQLYLADWKAPDYNQLCRGTPGSFTDNGWCIISSPLAKLLIEGVMRRAAPPRLAVTDARATHRPKAACVAQMAVFVTSGSVVSALRWLCAHSDSGFPPGTATVDLGRYREFRCPGSGLRGGGAFALPSAESERLATQEGDTKSLPNHLLSPALWSNASLARNRMPWFEHWRAVAGGPESSGTVPLLSTGVYC